MNKQFVQRLAGAVVAATFAVAAHAAEITGAGSTFVYPILSKWSSDYNQSSGNKVNYQSIGSGGGIAQIKAATVDFGASDMPMSVEDLKAKEMGQFPSVIGGVVPVVNIEGVTPGKIRFTGPLLADIYLGKIKKWDDPAIAKVNPGLKLPDANITVVHRSDGSGTTFNWVNYLSKVSPEWKGKVGEGTSVAWPTGVGGKGNEGVAAYVNRLKNSIGYVEYAYVLQNKMTYGSIQNKAGNFVEPDAKSFQAAAATADWSKAQDFDLVMTDAAGPDAYPVTATTFIIMYKQPKNAAQSKAAIEFFKWALEKGQQQAQSLDYVPLPDALVKQIEAYWSTNFKF
ncbi:phosphate ABC transporter substrate-binding protein PstS [Paraburkholderia fungorum]|uniref:Phosphate-binding protein PstS n=1 Tax=Paraburkholderia fungorum TaxID=134537 RepID=A0AAP5QBL8_9BURK|nr:phosphate ABC transporter substrate-binding protein PstS [Paraburkholderia fungorum]MDT8840189.1 phosphate ABC transporter substrate-binding protein PstS [Paraburkholderia fungorum]